ncbi:uncharacterized protein TNCV_2260981 [Trichonephila clavipes]|nr:uncharacterized protein TNCV_2260981 [Trichonephila clavipes]
MSVLTVKLPHLEAAPEPLKILLAGSTAESKQFLSNIRKYNYCFQLTSFGAEIVTAQFMPTFKIKGSFRSYYPYGLNVIWKGESVLLAFKQKSEDSLYIPNFDKSIDNSNNIRLARISRAKRRKRVTRDMSTLKNSMLELAVKIDDNYNTGLIKSFMFGMVSE